MRKTLPIALLALMAMQPEPRPLVAPPRAGKKWWLDFVREMQAIGARVKNPGIFQDDDVEWEVPENRLEEAKAIIAKYMTPEARAALENGGGS